MDTDEEEEKKVYNGIQVSHQSSCIDSGDDDFSIRYAFHQFQTFFPIAMLFKILGKYAKDLFDL